ncbi:hypothetical protein SARC_05167 [Sphaeroforma arctica JP610]|uniref:Uncharacterized protein n=1 Tax=Sphaeroforma arctica JP610 TaxID=667725 RepID=A0A0L0G147_9EUKA|nr:hypothetical protein SARC_05167 [Sphaeroforma arctica JP610]KNC82554.1 hypothetical protein SARC_05167 [Sphaeroforma arctica JP610]|eukprot:XP_014156456.1 hypothetical protein SARC_05167 [Sphaeroforma arctica JP610]
MLGSGDNSASGSNRIKWTRLSLQGDNYDRWDADLYLAALGDYEMLYDVENYVNSLTALPPLVFLNNVVDTTFPTTPCEHFAHTLSSIHFGFTIPAQARSNHNPPAASTPLLPAPPTQSLTASLPVTQAPDATSTSTAHLPPVTATHVTGHILPIPSVTSSSRLPPPSTQTYDQYHRNSGHRSKETTVRMAAKDNVTLTHPPPIGVNCEAWMLNHTDWQQAMPFLEYAPTIDVCAPAINAQVHRFAGPEGGWSAAIPKSITSTRKHMIISAGLIFMIS